MSEEMQKQANELSNTILTLLKGCNYVVAKEVIRLLPCKIEENSIIS